MHTSMLGAHVGITVCSATLVGFHNDSAGTLAELINFAASSTAESEVASHNFDQSLHSCEPERIPHVRDGRQLRA